MEANVLEMFKPDKSKSAGANMDMMLLHMEAQLTYLCKSAEFQNNLLKELYENTYDRCEKSENPDN